MTDKQIIIDGVDVSRCAERSMCINCETVTNCYYKQLKAKEQECERLKLDLIEAKAHRDYLNNLALSETLNLVSDQLDKINAKLEQEKALKETYLACYKAKHEDIEGKLFKLKQTLNDIKEIAKNGCYDDCGMPLDELSIILQKIKECEANNE